MEPGDVGIHIFQTYLLYSLLQWGVFPGPVLLMPWLLPKYNPRQPVLESPYNLLDAQVHEPSLCAKNQDSLNYYEV